mgnify:CR=1|tara:strand:- start:78 stop:539 length:462 start_codon:yes stop_codon:yes gene_type:complete
MRYRQIESLEKFLDQADQKLMSSDHRIELSYPKSSLSPWDADAIALANESILSELSGAANVYAIFTASKNSERFALRYVGKTTKKLARQRIRNHLIKKHERTGAKLKEVEQHIKAGGKLAISWVGIEPESLRNYIEEELIRRYRGADWNRENA